MLIESAPEIETRWRNGVDSNFRATLLAVITPSKTSASDGCSRDRVGYMSQRCGVPAGIERESEWCFLATVANPEEQPATS